MEQTLMNDFLMKQAPVIVVLLGGMWLMYKYFTTQQDKKDLIIAAKDEKLEEHQKDVRDLYGKAIEAQNRGNQVQEQLLEVLKETKEDVNELSKRIRS